MGRPAPTRPLGELSTEQRQAGRQDLDRRSTAELARLMNEEDASVPKAAAARCRPSARRALEAPQ